MVALKKARVVSDFEPLSKLLLFSLLALLLCLSIVSGSSHNRGAIVGDVRDSATAAGIAGATVVAIGTSNQGNVYSATTAANGAYVISNVLPANYDVTASKTGFDSQTKNNQPVQPFQTAIVNFQLTASQQGGVWSPGSATVSGTVRNVSTSDSNGPCPPGGCPVGGALVKVLGTNPLLTATTAAGGTYSIINVPSGTYDLTAGKPSDGYEDKTALNTEVLSGTVAVDFVLLRALGSCTDDCTLAGSNRCDASCHGRGGCWFFSGETKSACDGTFGILELGGGRSVLCCEGQQYTPIKADVTVNAKEIIKTVKPVVYQGKLVKLVTLVFILDKQH